MNHFIRENLIVFAAIVLSANTTYPKSDITYEFGKVPKGRKLGQCGIFSLYAVLYYNDVKVSYDEIFTEIKPDKNNQVNLSQLADYARRKGFHCKGIRNPRADLIKYYLSHNTSIIVHHNLHIDNTSRGHIMSLIRTKNDSVALLDYPRKVIANDLVLSRLAQESDSMLVLSSEPVKIPLKYIWSQMTLFSKLAMSCSLFTLIVLFIYLGFTNRGKTEK